VVHLTKYDFPKPWSGYSPPFKKAIPTGWAFPTVLPLGLVSCSDQRTRLHVRDARDAHTVFEAVRLGLLRPVTRRLNEVERSMYITSGAIFVWEESDDDLGLKRWTDGRVWSQSRMREVSRKFWVISQSH
jgi:hypothetical protein